MRELEALLVTPPGIAAAQQLKADDRPMSLFSTESFDDEEDTDGDCQVGRIRVLMREPLCVLHACEPVMRPCGHARGED